jgi:cell wall-associated NlpC family hydrolase
VVSYRSHRKPARPGGSWPTRVVLLTAVAGAAAALTPAAPAGASPDDGPGGASSARAAGARIDRLYEEAEKSTEKYNAAAERTAELRKQVEYAQARAARRQAQVNRLRAALASFAGAQYRSGGVDPGVALMLTADPDGYLDKAATLDRIGSRQHEKLTRLFSAQRSLKQQRAEAGMKLAELERRRADLKRHKTAVQKRLSAARKLLDELTPEQREERERASRARGRGEPVPSGGGGASSNRAAAAVAAARSAVGLPYVWGAAGPRSFDCSGLTQWAYGRAGMSIPRTSQGQRTAGRQVPLSQARPGDLVIYRDDASHVGMYVGDGQVVHAPHPGAQVRYDPVGMMPVSAVTRP